MGRITKPLKITRYNEEGEAKTAEAIVLFDSGASKSVMSKEFAEKIGFAKYPPDVEDTLTLADNETEMKVIGTNSFNVLLKGCLIQGVAKVVEKLSNDFIIGSPTLQEHRIKLVFANKDDGGDWIDMEECKRQINYL